MGNLKNKLFVVGIPIFTYLVFVFIYGGNDPKQTSLRAKKPIYFAKQGIAKYLPENSLLAIETAKIYGFNGIEVDVRKTNDGEYVLFNDENCNRLFGLDTNINQISSSDFLINTFIVNNSKTNHRGLLLKDMLDHHGSRFIIFLDMQITSFEDADSIAKIIIEKELTNSVIISFPDLFTAAYLENKYPELISCASDFYGNDVLLYNVFPYDFKPDFMACNANNLDRDYSTWLLKNKLRSSAFIKDVTADNIEKILLLEMENLIIDYDTTITQVNI
ncbi:MAG: hypothetical protein HRT72_02775 [Flavobacteriales bacterium]|nr:hypothetical protein [Flavobacteriales bacterium]